MSATASVSRRMPCYRIKAETIARQWGGDPDAVKKGLLLEEKTVPGLDEDTITISVRAEIPPSEIGAVFQPPRECFPTPDL